MSKRKEVALAAGVSEATVSHVINGTKYVSPELTERVRQAIKEKGYYPSQAARCLATNKSGHLALVINNLKNPRYAEVAEAMQEEARKKGYIVSTIDINIFNFNEAAVIDLISRNIDGIFLATYTDSMEMAIQKACESGIKVVSGCKEFGKVLKIDYEESIDDMVHYLADRGHKRIAFLSGYSLKESRHEKYPNFCRAMETYNLPVQPELLIEGKPPYVIDMDTGFEAMNQLLDKKVEVDAVFAVNDLVAIGAMKALRKRGVNVPDDISVVGCDDISFASYMEPELATIVVPKARMGKLAIDMLCDILDGKSCDDQILKTSFKLGATIGHF